MPELLKEEQNGGRLEKKRRERERESGECNERKREALSFVSWLTIFKHEGKGPIRSIKCSV